MTNFIKMFADNVKVIINEHKLQSIKFFFIYGNVIGY